MSPSRTVGSCISDNKKFLEKLIKTKSERVRQKLIDKATQQELHCLVESAFNILNSNFILPRRNLKKLAPFASTIRQLSKARDTKRARQVLQKGSGFPFAALLLPILAALIKS